MFKAVLPSLVFAVALESSVFHTLDTTSILPCTFSAAFQNRIMFRDGKIEKIIAQDEEQLSIFIEELSGQAFISRMDEDLENTALSVVLESGDVQDVLVHFVERSPEIVILENPGALSEDPIEKTSSQQSIILSRITDIIAGNTPEGYRATPVQRVLQKIKKGFVLESLERFEGDTDVLYLYQLQNTTTRRGTISETELQCDGARWVFLESNSLAPKQKIFAVICVGKDG